MADSNTSRVMSYPILHRTGLTVTAAAGFTLASMAAGLVGVLVALFTVWFVASELGVFEKDSPATVGDRYA